MSPSGRPSARMATSMAISSLMSVVVTAAAAASADATEDDYVPPTFTAVSVSFLLCRHFASFVWTTIDNIDISHHSNA